MKKLITLLIFPLLFSACSIKDDGLSNAEQEFNNSGQAKAIEDPTDLWTYYEDGETGFSLKYPHSVTMDFNQTGATLKLVVLSEEIKGLKRTMGYNEEKAKINMEALAKGEYGEQVDFALDKSTVVRDVDGTYAQDFLVLSRFEVCDISFERKLYFFHNDHQIVITLYGDKEFMMKELPEFFELNPENCFEDLVWKFEKMPNLYTLLKNGSGSGLSQEWFDTFDDIVDTIKFTDTIEDRLQGSWVSEDDLLSKVEFTGNIQKQIYDDEVMSEDEYTVSHISPIINNMEEGNYLHIKSDDESFEYKILSITDNQLELMYLPRGNILRYRR